MDLANERGWDVFDSNNGLTIQRDDELALFSDDEHAVLHVISQAEAGDPYAREALICVAFQDYERWEDFVHKGQRPPYPQYSNR